jgi:Lhr-like helicase
MENNKKVIMTETELSVIGMIFQDYGKVIEEAYVWNDEDWNAYQSIVKYLKEKQYICEE